MLEGRCGLKEDKLRKVSFVGIGERNNHVLRISPSSSDNCAGMQHSSTFEGTLEPVDCSLLRGGDVLRNAGDANRGLT